MIGGEYFPDQGNAFFILCLKSIVNIGWHHEKNRPEHSVFFRMFGIFCVKEVLFEKFIGLIKRKTGTRKTVSKTLQIYYFWTNQKEISWLM